MKRRLFSTFLTLLIVSVLTGGRGLWAAQSDIPEETQRQLASQTDSLRREREIISAKIEKKPVIEIEEERAKKPAEEEGPVFFVNRIHLSGSTIFDPEKLSQVVTAFENRQSSFGHLRSLSEIITNLYRSEGYVTSRAYLPPQTVENGNIEMKIIEGKVGQVLVEGNKYFSARTYKKYMRFGAKKIFRYQDLENNLYILNRRPDRNAKAYLIPGEKLASSDIILKVTDKNPFHAYYEMNNHGTKLTHRMWHVLRMTHNNLTGMDDAFDAGFTFAEQAALDGGSFAYNYPLESVPLTLNLSGGLVKSMLAKHLRPLLIRGKSINISPGVTYAFKQTPAMTIEGYAGLDFINSYSLVDDEASSVDRVRVLKMGPRFTFQDGSGRTILNSDIQWGLPDFLNGLQENNDPHASVANAGGAFTILTLNTVRLQRLPPPFFLVARAGGQWSPDTLASVMQYRAGGSYSVRGYPESDSAGDYGWNTSWELSSSLNIPKSWTVPYTKKSWKDCLRVLTFLDASKTCFRERSYSGAVKDKTLVGTGVGFRVDFDDSVSAQADLGFPIGDDASDNSNVQVHFSMRVGF